LTTSSDSAERLLNDLGGAVAVVGADCLLK
jgi:hypothetical protein